MCYHFNSLDILVNLSHLHITLLFSLLLKIKLKKQNLNLFQIDVGSPLHRIGTKTSSHFISIHF